jgi:hypothetical protein
MTNNQEKTILRDSGNGKFISKRKAARKPRNTWQQEQVPPGHPKRQSSHGFHYPHRRRSDQAAQRVITTNE